MQWRNFMSLPWVVPGWFLLCQQRLRAWAMAVLSSARAVTLAEAILVDWELARVHDSQRCSEQISRLSFPLPARSPSCGRAKTFRHYLVTCGSCANFGRDTLCLVAY